MPRGHPDWGIREYTGGGGGDLEVASRLIPPTAFFPDGEVFFYDGFEGLHLKWAVTEISPPGDEVALVREEVSFGEQCLSLTCGTGEGDRASVLRQIAMPVSERMMLGFFVSNTSGARYIHWELQVGLLTTNLRFAMRHDITGGKVYYRDVNGDYVELESAEGGPFGSNNFRFVGMVVDTVAQEYVRLLHEGRAVEMGIACYASAIDVSYYYTSIGLAHRNDDGLSPARTILIDDVILARNVP